MGRLGAVKTDGSANLVELLGSRIPRFQLVIAEWPTRCRTFAIGDRLKILRAIPDQDRAVELRVTPDIIVVARVEGASCAVEPGLLRPENAALKDGARVARVGAVAKPLAAFKDENSRPGAGESGRASRPSHARSHDQDLDRFLVHIATPWRRRASARVRSP